MMNKVVLAALLWGAVFCSKIWSDTVLYLRSSVTTEPGNYASLFYLPSDPEVLSSWQNILISLNQSGLLDFQSKTISAGEIQRWLPENTVLVGASVRYIPISENISALEKGRYTHVSNAKTALVRGGDIIKVVLDEGPVSLSIRGRAISSGNPGDRIPVILQGTGKRCMVEIKNTGTAVIR